MRRSLIMRLMVVLFLVVVPIRALAQETETYTTQDGLLSFDYPSGWIIEDSIEPYVILANSYTAEAYFTLDTSLFSEGDMAIVLVTPSLLDRVIEARLEDPTLVDVMNMMIEANQAGTRFSEPELTTLNGEAAVRVEASYISIEMVTYVVEREAGKFMGFDLYSYQGEATKNEPILLEIVSSFRYNTPVELFSHDVYDYTIDGLAFSPDGTLVTRGVGYGGFVLFDGETGEFIDIIETPDLGLLGNLVFRVDGTFLAGGRGGDPEGVRVWDSSQAEIIFEFTLADSTFWGPTISPDLTRVVAISWLENFDSAVYLWDLTTGENLYTREVPTSQNDLEPIIQAAFSPDGTRLAVSGRDYPIWIWDAATGEELVTIEGPKTGVMNLAFSPDGTQLAACSMEPQNAIFLWDTATGKEIVVMQGHTDTVNRAVFSADGRLLASASNDQTARLWDVESGVELAVLTGHQSEVERVAFNADGTRLASSDRDGVFKIWDVNRALED